MPNTLEERVQRLERAVEDLQHEKLITHPRTKDWRRTFGMFAGDPVFKQILDEAKRIREEDRAQRRDMIVLDSDHVSVLQFPESAKAEELRDRLATAGQSTISTTAVTIEEQTRGWLAAIHSAKEVSQQVPFYSRLVGLFDFFAEWDVLPFDDVAAEKFTDLRRRGVRIGSMDLKIASIALVHNATLLTSNLKDFQQVAGLSVEDWLGSTG